MTRNTHLCPVEEARVYVMHKKMLFFLFGCIGLNTLLGLFKYVQESVCNLQLINKFLSEYRTVRYLRLPDNTSPPVLILKLLGNAFTLWLLSDKGKCKSCTSESPPRVHNIHI